MTHAKYLITGLILIISSALQAEVSESIQKAMVGDHREQANISRNVFRHPVETLTFFGLKPEMTVVEIWPGGGWYTEILAPITREQGIYYAAGFAMTADRTPNWRKEYHKKLMEKMEKTPQVYDHVVVTELDVPERTTIAPPGSVDMVLTFRNVHNWLKGDYAEQMFEVMAKALKPGGILGLVEHRAKPGVSVEEMKVSGYMTETHVIAMAEKAGFVLEEKSEINANKNDLANHPAGVWTLPPSLRHCKKIEDAAMQKQCLDKYNAIGESDRMTLRFRKVK
ncbi:MAG: class I SAM-dependent methyltransferase [Gammaproteobacteria bacterium]